MLEVESYKGIAYLNLDGLALSASRLNIIFILNPLSFDIPHNVDLLSHIYQYV